MASDRCSISGTITLLGEQMLRRPWILDPDRPLLLEPDNTGGRKRYLCSESIEEYAVACSFAFIISPSYIYKEVFLCLKMSRFLSTVRCAWHWQQSPA